MKKRIDINEIRGSSPFRVPDGYFESLTSRVMSRIDEEAGSQSGSSSVVGGKGKVVAMGSRRRWIGWAVGIAACFVGVFVLYSLLQSNSNSIKNQTAQYMAAEQQETIHQPTNEPSVSEEKLLAQADTESAEEEAVVADQTTVKVTPKPIATQTRPTTQKTKKNGKNSRVSYTASDELLASNQLKTKQTEAVASVMSVPEVNDMDNEFIDYALMDDMEIYDYLAGVEYY